MARWWTETLDPDRHVDFMRTQEVGGAPVHPAPPGFVRQPVYLVSVCGFTFQFHSLADLRTCLEHFSRKIHPSSRLPESQLAPYEHYWQPWHQRLPLRLFEEARRRKVVHALARALAEWERDSQKSRQSAKKE